MYCVNCGVKLADTEKKCPLCGTVVYHPEITRAAGNPLYPENKMPDIRAGTRALCGAVIILFMIPMVICFLADLLLDGTMDWFGYAAGALIVGYIMFALPLWFNKPNPVIFVPCNFVSTGLYLLYIDLITTGSWFLSFAFPVTGGICLITCTVVTLLYYVRRGRLYIIGGMFIALGAFAPLVEFLMGVTFGLRFIGWSVYPLVVLILLGGLFLYLAISRPAREIMKRKFFF
ncbi:MAG: zinc ribbon domain-containing protein [Clostridia bacterium]|nr:zinc ribbon domain-containing protein [Clostridia bacterium]